MEPGDGDPRHGTQNGYLNLECRCDACRESNTASQAEYVRTHPEQAERKRNRMNELRQRRRAEAEQEALAADIARVEAERAAWVERESARKRAWRAARKAATAS